MSQPHTLVGQVIESKASLLYATAFADDMVVYRSVLVDDTSELFQSVEQALQGYELLLRQDVKDPDMMFGQAVLELYRLEV